MRHTWGVLVGIATGILLSLSWLAIAWVWKHFGRDVMSWFVNVRNAQDQGIGLLEAVPAALGFAVFGFGLEWIGVRLCRRVPFKSFAWGAGATCVFFAIGISAFMFFIAYASEGVLSFHMFLYALAMLALPLLGVRAGLTGARDDA